MNRPALPSTLPDEMRRYAKALRSLRAEHIKNYNRKKLNLTTHQEVVLLEAVRRATGKPHYEEVTMLLRATFQGLGVETKRYDGSDPTRALRQRRTRLKGTPVPLLTAQRRRVEGLTLALSRFFGTT